ncbi:hypothetical protein QFC22_004171 [Naganishia vaughanmartiniae]|uniref:Uncharacterized protein n=1 Tax=Naganishia vaughanmartiniae TaxID=1424756 RepID=A0ACC2X4E3_9TREE|nr:hypothetical protein QFC22_004171 [Naganishia vaughanmartiniae]
MGKALTLDDFHFLTRIGKGQFGKVDAVRFSQNGQIYALKTIEKTKITRAGQSLDINLEKDVLVRASVSRESSSTKWMPTPRLLATFVSPNCIHFAVSFANCGTLWDLFCSTGHTKATSQEWMEHEETALLGNRSQVDSAGLASLFHSMNGSSALSATSRRLPEPTFMVYLKQLVLAIQWLHEEAGIVHRDVKPENVLLTDDGRAVICDFGSAARLADHRSSENDCDNPHNIRRRSIETRGIATFGKNLWAEPRYLPLSACQTLHGTADYIAPEVLQTYEQFLVDSDSFAEDVNYSTMEDTSKKGYDASVDWWSFGAMCYEMISGLPPFYAKTVQETYDDSGFSVKMSKFLTSLLLPSETRLGRLGPEQVKKHSLFMDTDWDGVRNNELSSLPSGFENPKPLPLSFTNGSDITSAYQEYSSPFDTSTLHMSPSGAMPTWAGDFGSHTAVADSSLEPCYEDQEASRANPWLGLQAIQLPAESEDNKQWMNWNWVAKEIVSRPLEAPNREADWPAKTVPAEAYPKLPSFDKLKRESTPGRAQLRQAHMQHRGDIVRNAVASPIAISTRFKTPGRGTPGVPDAVQLEPASLSAPRTMPRTVTRGTGRKMVSMSEKRAFKLMVKCVEASAKKKISASGRKHGQPKNGATGPDAPLLADRKSNMGETSSAYRKRSFLSKLQALNVGDLFQAQELSNFEDSVHTAAGAGKGKPRLRNRNAPDAFIRQGGRDKVSSSRPVTVGFEAFMAELQNSANTSGFQSSPRLSYDIARTSYSSDSSDSSSIIGKTHSALVSPTIAASSLEAIPTKTHDQVPVHPLSSSKQSSIAPTRMERDELLSRLFPTYTSDPAQARQSETVDTFEMSPSGDEVQDGRMRNVDIVDSNEKSWITPTLPLDGKKSGTARTESANENSPTIVIKGLLGQHEQMKRSLAVSLIVHPA